MEWDRALLTKMYRTMVLIRHFEDTAKALFEKGRLPGFLHSSVGQEAVAAGAMAAIEPGDAITSNHRGHGHVIAKGARLDRMMAELFGKSTGYCRGKGGSMHIMDFASGILGANGIVGAGIPIAVGAGLAAQMLDEQPRVVLSFFGDGAANTGAFHEGVNLAAVWQLPVVFICENNQFAESTRPHQAMRNPRVADRALGYGIPGEQVDGNDVLAVHTAVKEAVSRARSGAGPSLVECMTFRMQGHYIGDQMLYRSQSEVDEWRERDPISRFERYLKEQQVLDDNELTEIAAAADREIAESIEFAESSDDPDTKVALEDIYA